MTFRDRLRIIGWGAGSLLVFYVAFATWLKRNELARQFAFLEHESASLAQENKGLKDLSRVISLGSVKEMEVKQRLNYAKPGETLVIFVSPSPVLEATATNWWDNVFKLFKRD